MPEGLPQPERELLRAFEDHLALERRLSSNTVAAYRGRSPAAGHVPDEEPLFPRRCPLSAPSPVPRPAAHPRLRSRDDRAARRGDQDLLSLGGLRRAYPSRPVAAPRAAQGRQSTPRPCFARRRPMVSRRRRAGRRTVTRSNARSHFATAPSSSSCTAPVSGSVRSRPSRSIGSTSHGAGCSCSGKARRSAKYLFPSMPQTPCPPTCETGVPRWPRKDLALSSSIGAANPSVSAISVRWWSGMALPCCRGGGSPRTPCGTRSPRTFWKEGPTSELSRNCSGTRASRRRSGTRTSRDVGSSRPTSVLTRGPDVATAKKVATKTVERARKGPSKLEPLQDGHDPARRRRRARAAVGRLQERRGSPTRARS